MNAIWNTNRFSATQWKPAKLILIRLTIPTVPTLPLVSIITPTLNQGNFIAQTIDSVLAQDYANLEYLIIDGGSTDETLEILRGYDNRIRWVSEADSGQSSAINKGWRKSNGEILAWLNSDDLLEPGAIQSIVAAFQQRPETAMVYGECDYLNQGGQIVGKYATHPWDYAELLKKATNQGKQRSCVYYPKLRHKLHCSLGLDYVLT